LLQANQDGHVKLAIYNLLTILESYYLVAYCGVNVRFKAMAQSKIEYAQ